MHSEGLHSHDRKGKKITEKATQKADPTTYTPLPIDTDLKRTGTRYSSSSALRTYPELTDGSGERYVDITRKGKAAPMEMIVTSVLKGIVNVADVTTFEKKDWKKAWIGTKKGYLSKIMPIDRVHSSPESEEDVDEVILGVIFRDEDHSEDLNIVRGAEGQRVFYDFEKAFEWRGTEHILGEILHEFDDHQLASLTLKLNQLESRLQGAEGLVFLNAVYEHAGQTELHAYETGLIRRKKITLTPPELQQAILNRILETKTRIRNEEAQKSEGSAT